MKCYGTFERLEPRNLLAGHVRASIVDGDLVIRGDDASNKIEIRRVDNSSVEVQGLTAGGSATSINGRANGSAKFSIHDDIICYLYGGNDRLSMTGSAQTKPLMVRDRLLVYGADGGDVVQLKYVSVVGDCQLSLGAGNDRVFARYLYVGDDLSIYGAAQGELNDKTIDIRGNNYVAGDTSISLGDGDDNVQISHFRTERLNVSLRDGSDTLSVDITHATGGVFAGGSGIDTLHIGANDFARYPKLQSFNVYA